MSDTSSDGTEQWLDDGERSKKLAVDEYQDTQLEAKITGPDVTSDEYYERLQVTELDEDSVFLHGWTKLQIPADPEALEQFISILVQARNRLAELEEDRSIHTAADRSGGEL
jgi:hypothetical protein